MVFPDQASGKSAQFPGRHVLAFAKICGDKITMMNHVFRPVLSERLGRSLGIDPIPLKTCKLRFPEVRNELLAADVLLPT